MHPCILVPDIGEFKKIWIQATIPNRFLEKRFMGTGGTCSHNYTIQAVFPYGITYEPLCILAACKHVVSHIDHVGQGLGIVADRRYIHNPCDIDAAVAYKDTDPGFFINNRVFRRISLFLCKCISRIGKQHGTGGRCSRCLHDRLWDVLWACKGTADKDTRSGSGNRCKGTGFGKTMKIKFNPKVLCQFAHIFGYLETS